MALVGESKCAIVDPKGDSGRKLPQYIATLSATILALSTGTVIGWSSPVVYRITQKDNDEYGFDVSTVQGDWVSSLISLGATVVCFPTGLVMDTIGRKKTMLLLVIPYTLGWLLLTFAMNVGMLMAGRFFTGMAYGASCVAVPVYNSEIAQDSIRGRLGSFFQLMLTMGVLFAYAVGSYTSIFVFNILCTLIPIIFGIIFLFMPESPNYLVVKGRLKEAKDTLIRLRGRNYDVDTELDNLQHKADLARSKPVSFISAITKRTALKAIFICYALMAFFQFSGINAVRFNTSSIFASAGSNIPAAIATIIIGVTQVVATFFSSMVVDKLGRRILLLISTLVMGLCSAALGVYFFLNDVHDEDSSTVKAISWLPLPSLSLFIIAFSLGIGPISWLMPGELCLIDIKAFVSSTAVTINCLASFIVTSTFNTLNDAIGQGQVFWIFAGVMLIGFLFTYFVVPETKGKSVDEVQLMLGAEPQKVMNLDEKK